jgi:hypothetical protein
MSASALRIDALGMRNRPSEGLSLSRMTKTAAATESAHKPMTMTPAWSPRAL